jgi:oligoribonuclease
MNQKEMARSLCPPKCVIEVEPHFHPAQVPYYSAFDNDGRVVRQLWTDFETTGLDVTKDHRITEAAFVFTDWDGEVISKFDVIVDLEDYPDEKIDAWVMEHTPENIVRARTSEQRISVYLLDMVLSTWLLYYNTDLNSPHIQMAGNSVWFDRAFMAKHMPRSYRMLHYRQLDMSSVEAMLIAAYPEHRKGALEFAKQKHHRAASDLEESLGQYHHYLKFLSGLNMNNMLGGFTTKDVDFELLNKLTETIIQSSSGSPVWPKNWEALRFSLGLVVYGGRPALFQAHPLTAFAVDESKPDDIRGKGWSVGVHNDYRLNEKPHTFWLFTKDDYQVKGEGVTDREALNLVRSEIKRIEALEKLRGRSQF